MLTIWLWPSETHAVIRLGLLIGVLGHSLSRSRGRPPAGTGLKRPFETFSNEIPTEVSALPKGNLRARYPSEIVRLALNMRDIRGIRDAKEIAEGIAEETNHSYTPAKKTIERWLKRYPQPAVSDWQLSQTVEGPHRSDAGPMESALGS